jgi:hypothetical protein
MMNSQIHPNMQQTGRELHLLAKSKELWEKIPESKRKSKGDPKKLPSKKMGHTLNRSGEIIHWTPIQQTILGILFQHRLVFFDKKSARQEDLIKWGIRTSWRFKEEDLLIRDYIQVPNNTSHGLMILVLL